MKLKETWRPCPDSLIDEDAERRWTSDNPCPMSLAWLLCWKSIRDGRPVSVRKVMDWTGWGSTRARRILAAVKEGREEWGEDSRDTVATLLQHGSNTAPTRAAKDLPEQSEATDTPATREQHGDNTPSRARSSVDSERERERKDPALFPERTPWLPTDDERALWARVMEIRGKGSLKLGATRKPKPTDAGWVRLRNLRDAIRESGPDAVLLVAEWARWCPVGRAATNRQNQCDDPDTWLRTCHWEPYLGFAREWDMEGRPRANGAKRKPFGLPPEKEGWRNTEEHTVYEWITINDVSQEKAERVMAAILPAVRKHAIEHRLPMPPWLERAHLRAVDAQHGER